MFHWINGQAGQHAWLDDVGKFAATRLAVVVVATLVGGWLLAASSHVWRDRELPRVLVTGVLVVGISLGLALLANNAIGHAWDRPRPFERHPNAHLIVHGSADHSFASDHATAGFALSFGALAMFPRLAAILIVESVLMSLGRVYVGLHYPGDVLGGLALGAGMSFAVSFGFARATPLFDRIFAVVNAQAGRLRWRLRVV
jgi:membrane-associated phospholipid phosphatase